MGALGRLRPVHHPAAASYDRIPRAGRGPSARDVGRPGPDGRFEILVRGRQGPGRRRAPQTRTDNAGPVITGAPSVTPIALLLRQGGGAATTETQSQCHLTRHSRADPRVPSSPWPRAKPWVLPGKGLATHSRSAGTWGTGSGVTQQGGPNVGGLRGCPRRRCRGRGCGGAHGGGATGRRALRRGDGRSHQHGHWGRGRGRSGGCSRRHGALVATASAPRPRVVLPVLSAPSATAPL